MGERRILRGGQSGLLTHSAATESALLCTPAFAVLDYAYADPGERIRAGQKSENEMVTDDGSLRWLALGAAGLLAWRKSRSRTARLEDA